MDNLFDDSEPKSLVARQAEELYRLYPKHVGRQDALKAIRALLNPKTKPHIHFAELRKRVVAYSQFVRPKKYTNDWKFVPGMSPWIRKGRWEDEDLMEYMQSGLKAARRRQSEERALRKRQEKQDYEARKRRVADKLFSEMDPDEVKAEFDKYVAEQGEGARKFFAQGNPGMWKETLVNRLRPGAIARELEENAT